MTGNQSVRIQKKVEGIGKTIFFPPKYVISKAQKFLQTSKKENFKEDDNIYFSSHHGKIEITNKVLLRKTKQEKTHT